MMLLSKKNISKLLLVLWMIFSIGYISWNIWSNARYSLMSQAYQQGYTDAVNQLIQQTENSNCQPIHVYDKDKQKDVQLINTNCLTKSK